MTTSHEDGNGNQDAAARAALRAFARAHHPDAGGDPEVFAAGIAELQAARGRVHRDRKPANHHDRFDAPIVVVARPRGPRGLVRRLRAWHLRRKRPPRVL